VNDQQLADAVIALDIGSHQHFSDGRDKGNWYGYDSTGDSADVFVRDWRVAGSLMEKCHSVYFDELWDGTFSAEATPATESCEWFKVENESLPRAIIEACVEALKSSHSDQQSEDQSEP
jgi:hypothetical protein